MGWFASLNEETYDRHYDDVYLVRRILTYLRPYRRLGIGLVAMLGVMSFIGATTPIIISLAIDVLQNQPDTLWLPLLVGALFVTAVTDYGANWLRRRLTSRLVGNIVNQMRQDAFAAAVNRDLAFYDETKSGKVASRITSDTHEFGQIVVISGDIVTQFIELFGLLFVMLSREWRLTLVMVAWVPVVIGIALAFRWMARVVTRDGARAMAAVNDNIQESVAGIAVAKNFRQEAMVYREFVSVNQQSYRINLKRGFVLALIFPALNALAGLVFGSVVYIGGIIALEGTINIAVWFLFIQGVDRFWFPFINLAAFWGQLQQGLSSAERIFALIDAENTIKQTDNQPAGRLKGRIEFDNVTFEYKPGQPVLKDFDLTIEPGQSIAFVGHTGAGKSTIAKLIARFYEFQGGDIRIDGRDIRAFDLQTYRRQLGLVPQQPFLFSGTIRDNIRYSYPEASDAEVEAIAYSIGNGEWLETLPDGLQSDVGERGARLSMGQRQLVSLLRVLLQKPAIFVLDEATASIDPFTETQIQEALALILAQSTSILIAHRLSTVRSADRIIVLKDGEIIESGNHESLLEQGGHYAELYNTYFRHQSLSYVENARKIFDTGEIPKVVLAEQKVAGS